MLSYLPPSGPATPSDNLNFAEILDPFDVDSEEQVLCNLIDHGNELMKQLVDRLPPEAFYFSLHQLIYSTALNIYRQGGEINLLSLRLALEADDSLAYSEAKSRLFLVLDRKFRHVDIQHYVESILDCYLRRQLINRAKEIVNLAKAKENPLPDLLQTSENKITSITEFRHHKLSEYRKAQAQIKLDQLTRELEVIEEEQDPFERAMKMKALRERWNFKSERDFLNVHASWLMRRQEEKSMSLVDYFNQHAGRSVNWLLDTWIPANSLTIVYGLGATGKTQFISALSQALITGKSWSGYEVQRPLRVLWVQSDQGAVVTTMLLDRQGFFSLSIPIQERQHILHKWGIEEYHKLEKEFKQNKFDVVVIDSLHSVSSGLCFKENEQEFARPLIRLRHLAEKYNVSFIIIAHASKQGELRGASSLFNSADQVWKLEKVNNDLYRQTNLTIQKSRYRQDGIRYRLQFDPESFTWSCLGEVTGTGEAEEINDGINPTLNAIKKFLSDRMGIPFRPIEIAEQLKIGADYCRKLLRQGLEMGLISCFKGRRSHNVYYAGTLQPQFTIVTDCKTDPPILTDPQSEDRSLNHTGQALEQDRSSDPQLFDNHAEKTQGSEGSEDRFDPRIAFDQKIASDRPAPKFRIGQWCRLDDQLVRISELPNEHGIYTYKMLNTFEGGASEDRFEPIAIAEILANPKTRAADLFFRLQKGQSLKALKHPDHKGFVRRQGQVSHAIYKDGKYWAVVESSKGIDNFNLEAVEFMPSNSIE